MRIRELLENKFFKDDEFVTPTENGREINFDLVDDLLHFMNHDDDVYRRHVYPSIAECLDAFAEDRETTAGIFKPAVNQSYQAYIKRFPLRELPNSIDPKTLREVCTKLHETTKQDIADGKYED